MAPLLATGGPRYFYPRSPCGERPNRCTAVPDFRYFYPRSPCGERHMCHRVDRVRACISIHALLAESDSPNSQKDINCGSFLSTLSLRRATRLMPLIRFFLGIFLSTLSLRRATLVAPLLATGGPRYFYPRSPCGERRRRSVKLFRQNYISIHALLAESDKPSERHASSQQEFLSTLSLRRATISGLRHK